MPSIRRRLLALLPIVILLALFAAGLFIPGLREALSRAELSRLIRGAGVWGPLVVVGLMATVIIISPLPNVPVSAVTGMVYGPFVGTALAVSGAIIGATGAFWISRVHGQRAIRALTGHEAHFCRGCSKRSMFTLVLIARLIPVVSFDVVSYGAGISEMKFSHFFWASLVGMIPWTWFYTSMGAALLDDPVIAAVLGILLGAAVLLLPATVRRWNPFGLRRVMLENDTTSSK